MRRYQREQLRAAHDSAIDHPSPPPMCHGIDEPDLARCARRTRRDRALVVLRVAADPDGVHATEVLEHSRSKRGDAGAVGVRCYWHTLIRSAGVFEAPVTGGVGLLEPGAAPPARMLRRHRKIACRGSRSAVDERGRSCRGADINTGEAKIVGAGAEKSVASRGRSSNDRIDERGARLLVVRQQ